MLLIFLPIFQKITALNFFVIRMGKIQKISFKIHLTVIGRIRGGEEIFLRIGRSSNYLLIQVRAKKQVVLEISVQSDAKDKNPRPF